MRYLVTGASGLLGMNIASQAAPLHLTLGITHTHPLYGAPFDTEAVDLLDPQAVERIFRTFDPDVVIHTAALAYPERCEEQPELARRVNAELAGYLAELTAQGGGRFLHISTDAVFDGVRGGYTEDDLPNPRNVYARTKLEAEQLVRAADPQALIARVVFYGWSLNGRRSLAEWFFNNLSVGNPVKGFTDAFFCPLEAGDLAGILLQMVEQGLTGTYHVVSSESISKYEFGRRIARLFGLDENLILPSLSAEGGLKAPRSTNLSLSSARLAAELGAPLPGQGPGLEKYFRQYHDGFHQRIRAMAYPHPSLID